MLQRMGVCLEAHWGCPEPTFTLQGEALAWWLVSLPDRLSLVSTASRRVGPVALASHELRISFASAPSGLPVCWLTSSCAVAWDQPAGRLPPPPALHSCLSIPGNSQAGVVHQGWGRVGWLLSGSAG